MVIGWVSPLMFCLFSFTLDKTNAVAIGYGGAKGCRIQHASSNLHFFAAPMGLLLFLNAVFFVLIVKSIRETMKTSRMATGQKRRKRDLGYSCKLQFLWDSLGCLGSFLFSSVHLLCFRHQLHSTGSLHRYCIYLHQTNSETLLDTAG